MIHICPLDWELKYCFTSRFSESESLLLFFRYYPEVQPLAIYRSASDSPSEFKLVKILSPKQVEKFLNRFGVRLRSPCLTS